MSAARVSERILVAICMTLIVVAYYGVMNQMFDILGLVLLDPKGVP